MHPEIIQIIHHAVADSHSASRHFGEIVGSLAQAGIESYRVDYRQKQASYFLPSGDSHTVDTKMPNVTIGDAFDIQAVVAAIRGSQRGEVKYPEFLDKTMRAGCVGYVVWITGRHVVYFGRNGEQHVEQFPDSKS